MQSTFYQRLLRETGVGRRDIKISIQPISTTNHTLQENNIDILHLEDIPDATLAAALDVDAFLKVTIITPIMLHSTTYDIPKEILNKSSILIDNPILSQIKHFNAVQVFLQAELIDSRQLEPIWAYTRRRDLEVHDKNTELLAWLSSDIAKNFPYR